ncbi:M28 family peptidase [Alteraurantiacibacter aquimixticola]|uniref:M28 family peptidase n=1 Tax=Alteraurantiacibacter aquimixticola TaxID=2489173 RepID=A0A4T3F0L4_9SPHN|nr:M28 family peptidase [Alteraurantiacibacter aquimixticola]TIX50067.1 M28 family peptidase [Alteraurantiacibacter aquimixticola]
MRILPLLAILIAAPVAAQDDPAAPVSEQRLRADVEAMVAFGTRHTLSDPDDPERGIGAARRWGTAEFEAISAACGGCLEIVHPERVVTGDRIPEGVLIQNVVAIQRGSERPNEVVIVQGHIDSRVSNVMDAVSDAPGANDNASGSALVLEAARVLSQRQYPTTVVYALLSGEEQGLFGGHLMADYALEQGWTVKAVLNNDVVGGSCGSDGTCDNAHVRVFSEGVRADADDATRAAMRSRGGANDSPSRNISRWLDGLAADYPDGLDVRQTWRSDRMGRGGDHLPFLERGLPAIRFSVAIEDYEHQHQDLRVEDGTTYGDTVDEMDFPYLAEVTKLNIRALDRLARAPMPPMVEVDGIVRPDVGLLIHQVQGAASYDVWYRPTDARDWQWRANIRPEDMPEGRRDDPIDVVLYPERGDDWIFGVSSVAADGSSSPVTSGVPGGDFYPLAGE